MNDYFGMVKFGRRFYKMTLRGFVVWVVVASVSGVVAAWLVLSVVIVALSPLYG